MKKIIVIKLGSSILMTARGKLDEFRIAHIADQIASLQQKGVGVVLVVSGAVACGYKYIDFSKDQNLRHAAAGVGQAILTATFTNTFLQKKLHIAQMLLTKKDLYANSKKQKMKELLEFYMHRNITAMINENDVLDLNSFGGNDHLAAKIALLINADRLFMLSTHETSQFGIGGGEAKRKVVRLMQTNNIQVNILDGKAQDIILQKAL